MNPPSSPRLKKWLRRIAWTFITLITLISLLTVYYQWENRRSARELNLAHERLIERIGTDHWLDLAPPVIPDEQNFFALPYIEQWMHREGRQVRYVVPKNTFWPENLPKPELIENDADGTSCVDFAKWATNRDLKGESPEIALHRELIQSDDWLEKLSAGLSRPFSVWKPHQREELAAAGANPYEVNMTNIGNINDRMRDLSLHIRIAAAVGDLEKTRSTALILLRLFPESATSHHWLIGSLVSLATHEIAFDALRDALDKPAWTEESLHALQLQLGKINDLEVIERALSMETLTGYGVGLFIRESCRKDGLATEMLHFGRDEESWFTRSGRQATRLAYIYGPTGWHDANTAFYTERMLDLLGPKVETAWLDGSQRYQTLHQRLQDEYQNVEWNMRRKISAMALPNIGNIADAAAKVLFHRRCLIIACELEKHRIKHGTYPVALPTLSGFDTYDPARPKQPLGYKLEPSGYVITSAHGWLWRMKCEQTSTTSPRR